MGANEAGLHRHGEVRFRRNLRQRHLRGGATSASATAAGAAFHLRLRRRQTRREAEEGAVRAGKGEGSPTSGGKLHHGAMARPSGPRPVPFSGFGAPLQRLPSPPPSLRPPSPPWKNHGNRSCPCAGKGPVCGLRSRRAGAGILGRTFGSAPKDGLRNLQQWTSL